VTDRDRAVLTAELDAVVDEVCDHLFEPA
jgi:hypothetical protein